jgi:hypothetical protein
MKLRQLRWYAPRGTSDNRARAQFAAAGVPKHASIRCDNGDDRHTVVFTATWDYYAGTYLYPMQNIEVTHDILRGTRFTYRVAARLYTENP